MVKRIAVPAAVAVLCVAALAVGIWLSGPAPAALAQNTACYMEQGGAKWVCSSGGEIEVRSGATLDVQSGSSTNFDDALDVDGATTLNSTLDVDGATTLNSTLDVDGNVTSGTGAFTVTDSVLIDGQADAVQLTVQGNGTQTSDTFVVENSAGTDLFKVTNAAGAEVVSGGLTVTAGGADVVAGGLAFAGLLTADAATAITVTNSAAFTPTGAFQPIQAAGEVTPTITIPSAGRLVCLYNTSSQTINIADTGNQVLTAAWAAGQYDFLCGYSDGTRFMEVSRADN